MINDYNSCVSTEGEAKRAPQLTITYNREIGLPAGLSTNAIYYIRNNNSGKYLQTGISTQATVTQNSFTNHRNQQWQLVHAGYGWYNIVPMSNLSLQLDVPNSSDTNGMRTQIYTSKNSNSQRFRLYDNGNGTVRIQPECSYISETEHGRNTNRVLEVENSSSSNGAKVQLWEYNGSKTMQWKFIQTPDSQDNSILSPEDRASILSLKRDYILYRNQGSSIYDYDGMCVSIMRAIDVIRRQSYYKGKYAFSDSAGTCNWTYMYEDGYTSSMKFHPITIETRPPEDYTLACNWALTIASAVTPWPYNAFIEVIGLSMLPSEPIDLISFSLTLFREEKWVTEGKLGTIATLTSLFSSAADAAANPPIGSDDFQVRIWYFNPNDISAIESYRIFVRSSFKVRHETQRSENVSSPPGYPTYDRNDLSYHNWTRHGSSKPGLVVNF